MIRRLRVVAALATVTRLYTLATILPAFVALLLEDADTPFFGLVVPRNSLVFLLASLSLAAFWLPTRHYTTELRQDEMTEKEMYLTIPLAWLVMTAFSAIPFFASGAASPINAWFDAMSGTTTTGATTLDAANLAPSLLFWRAALQYMGGMVIIVLGVALLGKLTQGAGQMLHGDTPSRSRARPKLAQMTLSLWGVYLLLSAIALTVLTLIFNIQLDMSWSTAFWEATITTMSTVSTGGFHHSGIASYNSWLVELVLIVFMLIAAGNFTLHYHAMHGDWRRLWKDAEWRYLLGGIAIVTLITTGFLWRSGASFLASLRHGSFTVVSMSTTTGFTSFDFTSWPETIKLLILVAMLTGATAGSTSGGLKVVRIALLIKIVQREVKLLQHPRAVIPIRLGGRVMKEETLNTVIVFFFAYIGIWLTGAAFLAVTEQLPLLDGAFVAASALGNVGPGLGALQGDGFSQLLPSSRIALSALMWIGRLEIFTALVLFAPSSWRS